MAKIVCFGEMLLRLSAPGHERLFQSNRLETNFVGAEGNVGVTLSRLGNQVAMISAVPDNAIGDACCNALAQQKIDTSGIISAPGRLATYFLETGAVLRPSAITYDRQSSVFSQSGAEQYDWLTILDGACLLFICGITLAISKHTYNAAQAAISAARAKGIPFVFDCNYREALWKDREADARGQISAVINQADVLFAGARDAELILGTPMRAEPGKAQFKDAATAFMQTFEHLSTIASTHRIVRQPHSNSLTGYIQTRTESAASRTYALEGIVDRIGGGDAFAGGVLHKLLQNRPLDEVINFGVAASALKHSIPGDFNLTSPDEVEWVAKGGGGDVRR